jgi:hypothetical protein
MAQGTSTDFAKACERIEMSAPEDRLVDDQKIESLQSCALAVLNRREQFSSMTLYLALGTLALTRDRQAREELAAIRQRGQTF